MSNSWIGKIARKFIYDRDELICCYCGKTCITGIDAEAINALSREDKRNIATLDHIVPQKELKNVSDSITEFHHRQRDPKNLVVVCVGCNSSKQHTPLYVWCAKTSRNYGEILAEIARRINITT